MREEHPFHLLGVLSAMTVHEVDKNLCLRTEFLRVLAEQPVVNGEKSLDVIQGILLRIAADG